MNLSNEDDVSNIKNEIDMLVYDTFNISSDEINLIRAELLQ